MSTRILSLLFLLLISEISLSTQNVTVFPTNPIGVENANLEVRVDVNPPFKECRFSKNNFYYVNATGSPTGTDYWENKEKTICKLKLTPIENKYLGTWTVIVVGESEANTSFSIGMDKKDEQLKTNKTVHASVGEPVSAFCTESKTIYGKVFRPDGSLAYEGLDPRISLPVARSQDCGVWKCQVQLSKEVNELTIDVYLNVTSTVLVESSVKETETQVNLLCRHPDSFGVPCLFESPTGKLVAPRAAVYTERYSYFGSDTDLDCGLSIRKPLNTDEIGTWKCLMTSPQHGSLLYVGEGRQIKPKINAVENISTLLGMDLTVQCSIQQPLTYCYLRSPLGRIFAPLERNEQTNITSKYTGLGKGQGDCKITIDGSQVWINESGIWICGMGSSQSIDDLQVFVNIQVASHFTADISNPVANVGSDLQIMCRSVMGYGLEYCRFMDPSGRSLNLVALAKQDRYSYVGAGLENGQCGLLIKNVQASDLGTWVCATKLIGKQWPQEFQDKIFITQAPISLGTLIGLSVGLGLLVTAIVGVFIFMEKRRRSRTRLPFSGNIRYDSRTSQRSNDSAEVEQSSDSHSS